MEISLVWQVFRHKPKYWPNKIIDLIMVQEIKVTTFITIAPEGDVDICIKFHNNPQSIPIPIKTTNIVVVLEKTVSQ